MSKRRYSTPEYCQKILTSEDSTRRRRKICYQHKWWKLALTIQRSHKDSRIQQIIRCYWRWINFWQTYQQLTTSQHGLFLWKIQFRWSCYYKTSCIFRRGSNTSFFSFWVASKYLEKGKIRNSKEFFKFVKEGIIN